MLLLLCVCGMMSAGRSSVIPPKMNEIKQFLERPRRAARARAARRTETILTMRVRELMIDGGERDEQQQHNGERESLFT